jgi:hypothetical protein
MKVNLKQEVKTPSGKSFNESTLTVDEVVKSLMESPSLPTIQSIVKRHEEYRKPLEVGHVIYGALTSTLDSDKGMSLQNAMELAKLSHKVVKAHDLGEIEFTPEQITLVKDRVQKLYTNNILIAVVYGWLDGKDIFNED